MTAVAQPPKIFSGDLFTIVGTVTSTASTSGLSFQQVRLLERAVTMRGGELVAYAAVASTVRSLARRARRSLFVVSGRATVADVASDLVDAIHLEQAAAHGGAVAPSQPSSAAATALRAEVGTALATTSVCRCVRAEWVAECVEQACRVDIERRHECILPTTTSLAEAAVASPPRAHRGGPLSTADSPPPQPSPAAAAKATAASVAAAPGLIATVLRPSKAFLPLYDFSSSAVSKPTTAAGAAGDNDGEVKREDPSEELEAIRARIRKRERELKRDGGGGEGAAAAIGIMVTPTTGSSGSNGGATAQRTLSGAEVAWVSPQLPGGNAPPAFSDTAAPAAPQPSPPAPVATDVALVTAQNTALILEKLGEYLAIYTAKGDQWRIKAYKRAIGALRRHDGPLRFGADVEHLPGIGEAMVKKIDEILATRTSAKLEHMRADSGTAALEAFTKIWGVGPAGARTLAKQFDSIAALRAAGDAAVRAALTRRQLAGLRYYEDLQQRIPRAEAAMIVAAVVDALRRTLTDDDALRRRVSALRGAGGGGSDGASSITGGSAVGGVELVPCGSYRRGNPFSGDVDILLCDRRPAAAQSLFPAAAAADGGGRCKRENDGDSGGDDDGDDDDNFPAFGGASSTRLIPRLLSALRAREREITAPGTRDVTVYSSAPSRTSTVVKRERVDNDDGDDDEDDDALISGEGRVAPPPPPPRLTILEGLGSSHSATTDTHCDTAMLIVQLADCNDPAQCPAAHRTAPATAAAADAPLAGPFSRGVHYARRLDLKQFTPVCFATACLYFTGSAEHNMLIRWAANKLGGHLSDKELVLPGIGRVPCETERDIFAALGLPYREPHERNL